MDCSDCYADTSRLGPDPNPSPSPSPSPSPDPNPNPILRHLTRVCGADGSGCAPKIYFAWVGTDKHGKNMLSAGRVLSRFAAGSVQGVVRVVNDQVDELTESQDS